MSRDTLLSLIDPDPNQPRQHFDQVGIDELARSMAANGLIVPILVRPEGDRFVVVHGERRYRAALSLSWETIRAEVRDVSPDEARWLSLVENVQRADLSPIEEARAYKERLVEGITQQELADRVGKGRTYIAQKLRLLRLPGDVQEAISAGSIAEGHARQLLRLKDGTMQSAYCRRAVAESWPVTRTRLEVDGVLTMFHEVTNVFPMMTPAEFAGLVASIRENGLIDPITTYQGKIVDGRQRWLACKVAGVEPHFKEWDGDGSLIGFVLSMNLYRQHLTYDQRVGVAVAFADELSELDELTTLLSETDAVAESQGDTMALQHCTHIAGRAATLHGKLKERELRARRELGLYLTQQEANAP